MRSCEDQFLTRVGRPTSHRRFSSLTNLRNFRLPVLGDAVLGVRRTFGSSPISISTGPHVASTTLACRSFRQTGLGVLTVYLAAVEAAGAQSNAREWPRLDTSLVDGRIKYPDLQLETIVLAGFAVALLVFWNNMKQRAQHDPDDDTLAMGARGRLSTEQDGHTVSSCATGEVQDRAAAAAASVASKIRSARQRYESDMRLMSVNNFHVGSREWDRERSVVECEQGEQARASAEGQPLFAPMFTPMLDAKEAEVQRGTIMLTRILAQQVALQEIETLITDLEADEQREGV